MPAPDRIVRHLRLRAADATQIRHALLSLEDALRCASLPDTGERLLLVRRLELGQLAADLSPQGLSLLLEQRLREIGGTWVHGARDGAAEPDAVWFASRLEAAQAALARRSRGVPLTAWYWPLALPGVPPQAPPGEFLECLLRTLGREAVAPVALPALVADLVAQGGASWLVRHLTPAAIAYLVTVSGAHRLLAAKPARPATAMSARPAWRPEDSALGAITPDWLRALLHVANPPAQAGVARSAAPPSAVGNAPFAIEFRPTTRKRAQSLLRQGDGGPPVVTPAGVPPPRGPVARGRRLAGPRRGGRTSDAARHEASEPVVRSAVTAMPHGAADVDAGTRFAPLTHPPFEPAWATKVGGLLFLITVLRRLGFPDWQRRHPDAPLCGAILLHAVRRLRVPADDAMWALLETLPVADDPAPRCWEAPASWADARIGLAHGAALASSPETMAARWLTACRRYLRCVARIGIASACRRPARLRWDATHLEVFLPIGAADLRVRREGLDIDPGWLDWLGRVVVFHYLAEPA